MGAKVPDATEKILSVPFHKETFDNPTRYGKALGSPLDTFSYLIKNRAFISIYTLLIQKYEYYPQNSIPSNSKYDE